MLDAICHTGTLLSLGNLGIGGWIGLILNLVLGVGFIVGLSLLVVLSVRRGQVHGATISGQPTVKEKLQAQYARGEITLEQYELKKQNIG